MGQIIVVQTQTILWRMWVNIDALIGFQPASCLMHTLP